MSGMVAGIDIGGTSTKACLVVSGRMIATTAIPTSFVSVNGIGDLAIGAVTSALTEAGAHIGEVSAIGIGVPGQVDAGSVRHAANLGIEDARFDLGGYVSAATGVRTLVENDMRMAAFGAYRQASRRDARLRNIVFIGLGTGVSAGVIVEGRVFSGSRGLAGEFGHVPMDTGLQCVCGATGCLETVMGSAGLRRHLGGEASELFEAAAAGNSRAEEAARQAVGFLARAMWWLAAAYDPDVFFIGGGTATNAPSIRRLLAEKWVELAAFSALAKGVLDPDRIRMYDLDEPVGALGAALFAAANGPIGDTMETKRSGRRTKSHE